ncbi:dihydropteroate synthase [Croceimicrobium sp.]|uniref:dihydropteroate synthase n=1 Tax=Croceimicrobium sp. TaxID=2828340 RepID=UPI003BAC5907
MAKDKAFYQKGSLNLRGKVYPLDQAMIMGILNINPDSFFDGGAYTTVEKALTQARKMQAEGADIIDLGPASSKPGSALIDAEKEWQILAPVIEALQSEMPDMPLSVDTYNARTAEKSWENGVALINDISGGLIDSAMIPFIGESQAPYVMMHMQGLPETMQQNPQYANVVKEVARFFSEQLEKLVAAGANDIILDPGFGFGKSQADNYRLFQHIDYFKQIFELPILIGLSRKSMIYKSLGLNAQEALNATTVMHTLALQKGANILRVHDVKEAVEVRKILNLNQNFA